MAMEKMIAIGKIYGNKLNYGAIKDEQIEVLEDSIRKNGFIGFLTVYENEDGETYTLVSGHKRLKALTNIYVPSNKVLCLVVEKPSSAQEEAQVLLRSNLYRKTKEDNDREILFAIDTWKTLPPQIKAKYNVKALLSWEAENDFEDQYGPDFREHPEYKRRKSAEVRGLNDFVREVTGLNISASSIRRASARAKKALLGEQEREVKPEERLIKVIDAAVRAADRYLEANPEAEAETTLFKFSAQMLKERIQEDQEEEHEED